MVPEGTSNSIAGFFARDSDSGAIYLMHTGGLRGGASGVGGRAFRAWHDKAPIEVQDAEDSSRFDFILVPVNAPVATRPLIRYIERVAAFRQAVADGRVDVENPQFRRDMEELDDFYKEPRGRRTGYRSGGIDYLSRHGEIVDALQNWRREQRLGSGLRIVKNVFIDLGIANRRNRLLELYEVKTGAARPDVYSAIGQLMVHGPPKCKKIVVLPAREHLANDLRATLIRHEVEVMHFDLGDNGAMIVG